jgi:Fibronectin type III domain
MAGWTTFNPSDTSGHGVLSGGNLIYTTSGGSVPYYARAIDGYSTGKFYFEVQRSTSSFDYNCGGGVALLSVNVPTDFAAGNGSLNLGEYGPGNQANLNSASLWANALSGENVNMAFAIDLTDGVFWVNPNVNGGGSWNNSGTATPFTSTGGISLGILAGSVLYPFVVSTSANVYTFTANFGQSAFLGSVPSGYTAGWPGSTPDIPTDLHQTGATLTSITMAWAQGGSTTPDSYTLQYRLTGTMSWTQVPGLMTTSTTIMGLLQATQYDFQVLQIVAGTPSDFTATAVGSTLTPPAPVPPQPQALSNVPRSSGGIYRGQVGINFMGNVLVGDAFSGVIGKMNFNTFTEYGNPMWGLIASPPIHDDRKRVFLSRFEIDIESGVGLSLPDGALGVDPVWMLDWSKDGGRTFGSPQLFRSMGRVGKYLQRLRWLRLGESRQWILRLQSTDPVRRVIIGTYVDVTKGVG